MPYLPPEALRLVEDRPDFLAALAHAKGTSRPRRAPVLRLTVDAFADDPFCLYACLLYAAGQGVEVRFLPGSGAGAGLSA